MSAQRIRSETFPDAAILACHLDPAGPELGGPPPPVPVDYYRNLFTQGVVEIQCHGCPDAFESDNLGEFLDWVNAHNCDLGDGDD